MTEDGRRWIVDGMNVVGSRGDGWWADPPAAIRRLIRLLATFAREEDADVTVVFDGAAPGSAAQSDPERLTVLFAADRGAAEADDLIVELAEQASDRVRVVTSDRGLSDRLPDGVEVLGAGGFRERLEALADRD